MSKHPYNSLNHTKYLCEKYQNTFKGDFFIYILFLRLKTLFTIYQNYKKPDIPFFSSPSFF
jgi:hypothetical protein